MQKFSNVYLRKWIAYVMINCESSCEESVLEKIGEFSGIKEVKSTVGNYDMVIKIESESMEQMRDLISIKIRSIPQILTTTTLLCTEKPTQY